MITEALMSVMLGMVGAMVGLLPDGEAPSWVTDAGETLSSVLAYAAPVGNWLPLQLAGTVLVAFLACVAAGFGIKVARIVASFLTVGGGSAG